MFLYQCNQLLVVVQLKAWGILILQRKAQRLWITKISFRRIFLLPATNMGFKLRKLADFLIFPAKNYYQTLDSDIFDTAVIVHNRAGGRYKNLGVPVMRDLDRTLHLHFSLSGKFWGASGPLVPSALYRAKTLEKNVS